MGKEVGAVFELSWEVCNKVGGIYTVLSSKAAQMVDHYGEDYFAVGPYVQSKAQGEFQEKPVPPDMQAVFDAVKAHGIVCHYGSWLVDGHPSTILIDFSEYAQHANDIKTGLWNDFKVDSLGTNYHDVDEPLIWATAAAVFVETYADHTQKKCVMHCHEWLAGGAILHARQAKKKIGCVFTTHATMLGRTIAGSGGQLYEDLEKIDPEKAAYESGIQTKYQLEKVCAKAADMFSTVSEITGIEAEHLLGKKPDILLPNGLDLKRFPTIEEAAVKHIKFRRKVKEFLIPYFFPHYTFELDNTLIYFLFGRQEIHNKGIDVFIAALQKLNEQLKKKKNSKTIVAILYVPGNAAGVRQDLLQAKAMFDDIRDAIVDNAHLIEERLIYAVLSANTCNDEYLMGKELQMKLTKSTSRFLKKSGQPPLSTHDFHDEGNEQILQLLQSAGLTNKEEDKVKVIYFPAYLNGADGLLDLDYYEGISAGNLGVFPSYYEPYGYTPLEAGALGVPAVTTDLAGFGRYICNECTPSENKGIRVIKRMGRTDDDVIRDLAHYLGVFANYQRHERAQESIAAKQLSQKADWEHLVKNYFKAHEESVKRQWN